jgi:hypothetical protein
MLLTASSLIAVVASAAMPQAAPSPRIAHVPVLEVPGLLASDQIGQTGSPGPGPGSATVSAPEPAPEPPPEPDSPPRIAGVDVFAGGKLLLTNGVTTVEGSSGGGLARWATIGGRQMTGGIGLSAHGTAIELSDYGWRSYGVMVGIGDRLELSYARAGFDTRDIGAALGIGLGYTFNLDTFGAKLRVAGDLVYGETWLPQIAVGIEHKRSRDGALVRALGAADASGTDYTLSATKLFLARSLLVNATLRYTQANELGLLGFGSSAGAGYELQFEGSLGYQLSRRAVVGAEYRTKPDNLGLGDDDWLDVFAAYALTDHLTLTAAYVDLGSIATIPGQRGGYLSAQVAF